MKESYYDVSPESLGLLYINKTLNAHLYFQKIQRVHMDLVKKALRSGRLGKC